jgi:hypothetical protein
MFPTFCSLYYSGRTADPTDCRSTSSQKGDQADAQPAEVLRRKVLGDVIN